MTSRFGKTYSRKAGGGGGGGGGGGDSGSTSSKFDEVLSGRRRPATLSTKWGQTTYRATLGSSPSPSSSVLLGPSPSVSKRPRPSSHAHKKPRLSGDAPDGDGDGEDPFGFDSDEESKPVSSSRGGGAAKGSLKAPGPGGPPTTLPAASRRTDSTQKFFNHSSVTAGEAPQQSSYSWYLNASDSDRKPRPSQTTALRTDSSSWVKTDSAPSAWKPRPPPSQAAASLRTDSASSQWDALVSDRRPPSQAATLKAPDSAPSSWDSIVGLRGSSPSPPPPRPHQEAELLRFHPPAARLHPPAERLHPPAAAAEPEADEFCSSSSALSSSRSASSSCRTYRRPDKKKQEVGGVFSEDDRNASHRLTANSDAHSADDGRGRRRDLTVLQPSCLSVSNAPANQDRGGGLFLAGSLVATETQEPSSDWLRKEADAGHGKPSRCTQQDVCILEEEDEEVTLTSGSSKVKIKYFGFDEMSGTDEEEEEEDEEGGGVLGEGSPVTVETMESPVDRQTDSPPDPFDRLMEREDRRMDRTNCYSSTRTGVLDFMEDDLTIVAGGPTIRRRDDSSRRREDSSRRRAAKMKAPAEENPDEQRRIFSALKKSPHKAVYNARHWTVDSEEEPPPAYCLKSHNPAAVVAPPPPSSTATGSGRSSQTGSGRSSQTGSGSASQKDDALFKAPPPPPKVTKSVTVPTELYQDPVTTLRCRKEHKELYTVVQHVKHFNDVVEFGENQEFTDDFEYLATGLKTGQPLNTRCLSVISLATRCAMGSFRMHLRARGKVAMVFKTLEDAPQHPNLALCTASLMYILSRDRLNMDLDRSCLDLMIRLLELELEGGPGGPGGSGGPGGPGGASSQLSTREMTKVKEKIRKLCEMVHNKHLDLQNITAGHLAMETLLSLTSKRAGDWFKEELRLLGGLDHIVDKVKECVDSVVHEADEDKLVSSLWGAERCLRVLESVSHQNSENQSYLIAYKDSSLIISSAKALNRCECLIVTFGQQSPGPAPSGCYSNVAKATRDCMRAVIGCLLNLTHDNEWGSTKTGEQDGLITTALNCVLKVPQFLPQEQRFDIRVLGLGLLINLVEYSSRNKHCVMDMQIDRPSCDSTLLLDDGYTAPPSGPVCTIAALVQLFVQRERAAVLAEAQTDDIIMEPPAAALDQSGEWKETSGEIQWVANDNAAPLDHRDQKDAADKEAKTEEDGELDLNKALVHAGKHMEDSMVASYTALLLGSLCQGSPMNVLTVREALPQGDFSVLTEMLKKFLNFMNLTCDIGTAGQKSISRVIDYLEHC